MLDIDYFKSFATPLDTLFEALIQSDHKISFSFKEFKTNLINIKDQEAYCFDENGVRQEVSKRTMLSSFFDNYLLTFYEAKVNVTEESLEILCKMIDHICMLHRKLYEVVDQTKKIEFIQSFNEVLATISIECDKESLELILAYMKIHQNKPIFD